MRNASIAVLREIGVETGGSNVQFAVHPDTGRLVVIEMNPRVSRSSALASKATGFPIAKIAAKLAVGYTLDELDNDITQVTPASFEPTIDYVVTKIPRFAFEKFPGAEPLLTTAMKSVGEAMAIGRTFHESVQKALCSLETGLTGFDEIDIAGADGPDAKATIVTALSAQTPDRLRLAAQAMRHGLSDDEIHAVTRYDPWFLARIREIVDEEARLRADRPPARAARAPPPEDARLLRRPPRHPDRPHRGLGPRRAPAPRRPRRLQAHRHLRRRVRGPDPLHVLDLRGRARWAPSNARPARPRASKVVILGGGPNRIGQGIEFDYCCCHACFALTKAGYETIMVNCNPETVSTDYDTSDRLYFEPLTLEHVLEILRVEQENGTLHGVIVQFGGQTPAEARQRPARRRHPDPRHHPRRHRPRRGPRALPVPPPPPRPQPADQRHRPLPRRGPGGRQAASATPWSSARATSSAAAPWRSSATTPSSPATSATPCRSPATPPSSSTATSPTPSRSTSTPSPTARDVHIAGVMEHIEEAGVHSGDSACSLPPWSLDAVTVAELKRQTESMALALGVVGLMNVQFAIQNGDIYVLEVNPRASRTVPFVAKATDSAIAAIAARVMAGEPLSNFPLRAPYPAGRRPRRPAALRRPDDPRRPRRPPGSRSRRR